MLNSFVYSKSRLLLHLYEGNKVWTTWFLYKFTSIWRKFPFIPWKSLSRKSTLLLYFPKLLNHKTFIAIKLNSKFFNANSLEINWHRWGLNLQPSDLVSVTLSKQLWSLDENHNFSVDFYKLYFKFFEKLMGCYCCRQ